VTISVKLIIAAIYVISIAYVHLRGRVRHKLGRQLSDHSTFLAPINCFLYLFSKKPNKPFLDPAEFPDLSPLQAHWQEIREEGQNLLRAGEIKRSNQYDDVGFNSFFKTGWKRFYLKWYGEPLASAEALCPETVKLLNAIPSVKAAMFALLPPGSKLNPHRDPFAGSLRYHLGLITPNSDDCRIFVDGEMHAWRDGKDVVFDETYVHWAENRTDQTRVILFADVERPLKSRLMTGINKRVGAFMGSITASPNDDESAEQVGFVNRMFALNNRGRDRTRKFKKANPKLFRVLKYIGIVLMIWLIFLAPYPFFRGNH
jgi:beta-hydroxylase